MSDSAIKSTIEEKEVPAQKVATVRTTASQQDVFTAIPDGLERVITSLITNGTGPTGAPFAMFHAFPTEDGPADLSVCVPVDPQIDLEPSDVQLIDLVAGPVASLVHVGPYSTLQSSYAELAEWLRGNDRQVVGPSREIYLNSPGEVDESELLTEIQFPIAAR